MVLEQFLVSFLFTQYQEDNIWKYKFLKLYSLRRCCRNKSVQIDLDLTFKPVSQSWTPLFLVVLLLLGHLGWAQSPSTRILISFVFTP